MNGDLMVIHAYYSDYHLLFMVMNGYCCQPRIEIMEKPQLIEWFLFCRGDHVELSLF
jgi:hypothetical protein